MASRSSRRLASKRSKFTAGGVWKGENESDPELMETRDKHPLCEAEAWTEDEAYKVYREKLVRLRDLYVGQLGHMKHVLQEKRREFLQRWQHEGGALVQASQPSHGGSLEDAAYRCYRKRSGEEALLERKQKRCRISSSLDYFCKRDARDLHKSHHQYLLKLHQQTASTSSSHCSTSGCEHPCLPFSTRCSRHICDDEKQLFYTKCSYTFPSGAQCSNPVPLYITPPYCGGHCDNIDLSPPKREEQDSETGVPIVQSIPDSHDNTTTWNSANNMKVEKTDIDVQR